MLPANLTDNLFTLLAAALGGGSLAAIITALANARTSARKSDLDNLRSSFDELRAENARLQDRIERLETENAQKDREIGDLRVRLAESQAKYVELDYKYRLLMVQRRHDEEKGKV
jgi:septal ring factor EnvC (AmiA/AmiB activator)